MSSDEHRGRRRGLPVGRSHTKREGHPALHTALSLKHSPLQVLQEANPLSRPFFTILHTIIHFAIQNICKLYRAILLEHFQGTFIDLRIWRWRIQSSLAPREHPANLVQTLDEFVSHVDVRSLASW